MKIWMPRPFPGGKSTWVGNVSRRGELNVPTYAMRGAAPAAGLWARKVLTGEIAASAAVVFRNERRDGFVGLMTLVERIPFTAAHALGKVQLPHLSA